MTFNRVGIVRRINVRHVVLGVLVQVALILPLQARAIDIYGENGRPFNLSGTVSYGYNITLADENESELNTLNIKLSGNSPIWQPWFATLSAGVGLGFSASNNSTGTEGSSDSNNINLNFVLFPVSRFPFRLSYARSANEIDAQDFATTFTPSSRSVSQSIGLAQTYLTRDNINYNLWYNRNEVDSDISGEYENSSLGFSIDHSRPKHRFELDGSFNSNEQKNPDFGVENSSIHFSHGYFPSQFSGVNSLLSYANGQADSGASGSGIETSTSQASTAFSWRPEHKPYSISGGIRFSQTDNLDGSGTSLESNSVNTSGTASYRISRHARSLLSISATLAESAGRQTLSTIETFSLGYSSDSYVFSGINYSWSAGLGASNGTTDVEGLTATGEDTKSSSQSASLSLGHSLGKNWAFSDANFSMGFSQGLGASKSFGDEPVVDPAAPPDPTLETTEDEVSQSLSQSLTLGGNHYGWGGSTVLNASFSDNRTLNEDGIVFQLMTAQLSRNQGVNRLSSMSVSITYQANRTEDPGAIDPTDVDDIHRSASASISYEHGRFFGVFGLRYKTKLEQTSLFSSGDTKEGNVEWENVFNYSIGLLTARLGARLIRTPDDEETRNMFFQATRTF